MINLISPKEKKKLFLEKMTRMIIVLWFLVFFFMVCLILVFLTVRIYAKSQLSIQESFVSSVKEQEKIEDVERAGDKADITNSNLEKLNSFYSDKVYFSSLVEKTSKTLPSNLYLTSLSIISVKEQGKDEYVLKVSLAGFSPSRDDLLQFKDNLESEEDFVNVSFPAFNWVKKVDIDFSVSFEIKV